MSDLVAELRDRQLTQVAGPVLKRAVLAAADRIEELETDLVAHRNEVKRLHYWLSCIAKASMDIEDMTDAALKSYYIEAPSDE
jgi:hypothetical protein